MENAKPPLDSNSLNRIIEALTGLSTLSSVWNARDPQSIAEDLASTVLRSLPVHFAHVRLRDPAGISVEVVRRKDGAESSQKAKEIGEHLEPLFHGNSEIHTIANPFGNGTVKVAIAPVGVLGDCGFLAAGSPDAEFPVQADHLFLSVAANQAAVVLQHQMAEQALQESEQRFARFMQNLPGLAWIKDAEGRYVYANHSAEQAFRTASVQLYGKTDEEVFPPETAARFRENDRIAIARPSGVQIVESLMHDDGVLHHSVVSKFPIPGKDGTFLIGGIAFDITDRVQAEKTALEASRQKDAFFAVLGHELRNPLSPMLTAIQLMRLRGIEGQEVEIMERQVSHMLRLVDDLLDVSRITSGKVQLHLEDVDLAAILVRTLDTVGPLLEQRHHKLHVHIPKGVFGVRADPARLTQVITNLLVNAAKYSDEGSNIALDASGDEDFVRLSVRDEGVGIMPEMLDTIFDNFVQRPESLDRSRDGLGLGLAIVRSLVRQHGGRVFARSDGMGKGSEFVVELPAVVLMEQPPNSPTPARPRPALGQRDRILVVDDNRDAAETLQAGLEHHGYDVQVAFDAATAMEIARAFRPRIALLDIGMPDMSGYELAQHLRAIDEPGGKLRLVAVTGFGQPGDRERAFSVGFDRHFVKPVDLKTLLRAVEELSLVN